MTALVTRMIRLRNPGFTFAGEVDLLTLCSFVWHTALSFLAGWRLLRYGKWPRGAMVGAGVRLRYSHRIRFGKLLKLGRDVSLEALGREGIHLGDRVSIGDFSKVVVSTTLDRPGRGIHIGDNVGMGEFAYLGGAGGLHIGADCIIGQYFSCHPENHHFAEPGVAIRHQGTSREGIRIGRDCWIGAKVTILDGVTLGDHCVVAAGAVVNRSFPADSIIGGVPARLLSSKS